MSSGFLDSLTWRPHEEEVTLCICDRVGVEGTAPADTSLIDTPTYSIFCPSCCTQQKRVPERDTLLIYCQIYRSYSCWESRRDTEEPNGRRAKRHIMSFKTEFFQSSDWSILNALFLETLFEAQFRPHKSQEIKREIFFWIKRTHRTKIIPSNFVREQLKSFEIPNNLSCSLPGLLMTW